MDERKIQPKIKLTPEDVVGGFESIEQMKNIKEIFKLHPELRGIASRRDDKEIVIELGRNKVSEELGKVQNINVYYKDELIIDSDNAKSNKFFLVTKEDGTSYVGDIFIPTDLQGQGLGLKILQKVADTLDTKIIPTHLSTGGFTSDNAKKMWEKVGNEIVPNDDAEKLYGEYLETIFPESKVKEIVFHGTNDEIKEFIKEKYGKNLGSENKNLGFYFTDRRDAGTLFGGSKTIPNIINVQNPKIQENLSIYVDPREYDGIISKEVIEDPLGDVVVNVFVAFEPEQVHILGSQSDIEGFKKFVEQEE